MKIKIKFPLTEKEISKVKEEIKIANLESKSIEIQVSDLKSSSNQLRDILLVTERPNISISLMNNELNVNDVNLLKINVLNVSKNIKSLDLRGNKFSGKGTIEIAKIIAETKKNNESSIDSVDFGSNEIDNESAVEITRILAPFITTHLGFKGIVSTTKQPYELGLAVESAKSKEEIKKYLEEIYRINETIDKEIKTTSLNISKELVKANSEIKSLDFGSNRIRNTSKLIDQLVELAKLKNVDFSYNFLSDSCDCTTLIKRIGNKIQHLNLKHNLIGYLDKIDQKAEGSLILKKFDEGGNNFFNFITKNITNLSKAIASSKLKSIDLDGNDLFYLKENIIKTLKWVESQSDNSNTNRKNFNNLKNDIEKLANNVITILAEGIKNSNLQAVDLSDNGISLEECTKVLEILLDSNVKYINISSNGFDDLLKEENSMGSEEKVNNECNTNNKEAEPDKLFELLRTVKSEKVIDFGCYFMEDYQDELNEISEQNENIKFRELDDVRNEIIQEENIQESNNDNHNYNSSDNIDFDDDNKEDANEYIENNDNLNNNNAIVLSGVTTDEVINVD